MDKYDEDEPDEHLHAMRYLREVVDKVAKAKKLKQVRRQDVTATNRRSGKRRRP